jgi:hypothetical protein
MKLIYVVRRSKDYFENKTISNWTNAYNGLDKINIWNDTFNINYYEFRKKVNKIRKINQNKLKFDKYFDSHIEDNKLLSVISQPNNLIFPTDDDDWYCHDITNNFKTPSNKCYRWRYCEYINGGEIIIHPETLPSHYYIYQTNNYAIPSPISNYQLDHRHGYKLCCNKEIFINKILSVHNKNLGSLSLMMNLKNKNDFIKLHEKYLTPPKHNKLIPNEFYNYIDMMVTLYKQLKPKSTIKFI